MGNCQKKQKSGPSTPNSSANLLASQSTVGRTRSQSPVTLNPIITERVLLPELPKQQKNNNPLDSRQQRRSSENAKNSGGGFGNESKTMMAITKIQRQARRNHALRAARAEIHWKLFAELDTKDEAEMLSLAVFMQTLMDLIAKEQPENHEIVPDRQETLKELNNTEEDDLDDNSNSGTGNNSNRPSLAMPPVPPPSVDRSSASAPSDRPSFGSNKDSSAFLIKNVNFTPASGKGRSFVPIQRKDGLFDFSHVSFTPVFIPEFLKIIRNKKVITEESVKKVLRTIYRRLKDESNTNKMQLDNVSKLSVVGDLHGQLEDLFHILDESGLPNENNKFIFNGDFVDRGENSFEVVLLLFVFYIVYGPNVVSLNRGNHEDMAVCNVYGFQREVESYGLSRSVYEMFGEVFRYLPLFTLVNEKLFVVHGGLFHSPKVTLEDLAQIPRHDYNQKPPVPYPDNCRGLTDPAEIYREYLKQLQREALWSDPIASKNGAQASDRGAGVLFGADLTRDFMNNNGLAMIIRSHQCVFRGAEFPFDDNPDGEDRVDRLFGNFSLGGGNRSTITANNTEASKSPRLLTVFSASNYCKGTNFGAYVQFATHSFGNKSVQVDNKTTDLFYQIKRYKLSVSQQNQQNIIESNKTSLKELILKKKSALVSAFEAVDTTNCGTVSRLEWAEVMQRVTLIKILWLSILPSMVPANCLVGNNVVNYRLFVDAYTHNESTNKMTAADHSSGHSLDHENVVFDDIYGQRKKLEKMFYFFDLNGDGVI
jgi:serine/threonine-protein phosphatase with EF-hand domain